MIYDAPDKPDRKDSSEFAAAYKRTVLVSPVGTPNQNGNALRNALASITGASQDNAYLIKIEPGGYDVGLSALDMKQWVDMEGSGEINTKITHAGAAPSGSAALHGANNAELRFLTVELAAAGTNQRAIFNHGVSPRLTQITLITKNSRESYGLYTDNSAASVLTGVTIKVESRDSTGAFIDGSPTRRT